MGPLLRGSTLPHVCCCTERLRSMPSGRQDSGMCDPTCQDNTLTPCLLAESNAGSSAALRIHNEPNVVQELFDNIVLEQNRSVQGEDIRKASQ